MYNLKCGRLIMIGENAQMYFDKDKAADPYGNKKVHEVVDAITTRHIRNNGPQEYIMLPYFENGFSIEASSRTVIDFNKIFPQSKFSDVAYARCYVESPSESDVIFFSDLSSDTIMYLNGKQIGKTIDCDEALGDVRKIYAHLNKGRNTLLLRCKKTTLGFGAKTGRVSHRGDPFFFMTDTDNVNGTLGWEYSDLYCADLLEDLPDITEAAEKIVWHGPTGNNTFKDVYDGKSGYVYAATFLECDKDCEADFSINTNSMCRVFVNGAKAASGEKDFSFSASLSKGTNYIVSEICSVGTSVFDMSASAGNFALPFEGNVDCKFIYTGPLAEKDQNLVSAFSPSYLPGGCDYWRVSRDITLRLSDNKSLFGKWSYPLGVSMRGMLTWSKKTCNREVRDYLDAYIKKLTDVYKYARWDAKKYTVSYVLRQQSIIELLDDFGSFESALIDMAIEEPNGTLDAIILRGADFVKNKLPRLSDGTMYREALLPLHRNINHNHKTMWADDLYMGACFMCRYYAYTGDETFIDDAALQFKRYFDYLFIEEKELMSHVYSFRRNAKTNVAWGRGNGWVLFSLTELLSVMPTTHKDYQTILSIYQRLCKGVLAYQNENGMWHQVINDKDSFAETSCTAMFGCAFLRGIRNCWIQGEEYLDAAINAWRALCTYSLDNEGNIYGICKGSGFSFREDYYKKELPWVFNDTHGMGIVLLFASEVYNYIE